MPFPKSSHCGHHIHKPTKLGIILKRSKTLKMPLLSKLRNQKTHSKLEEWTQLSKKLTLFKRSWSRVIELSMTYFLTKRLVHPYFDIKVPFLRLLPVVSGGKLKNPKLRNNFSRIHSKFCSGQITYWMGDYEIFRHEIKNDASFKKTNGLLGQPHVSFQTY